MSEPGILLGTATVRDAENRIGLPQQLEAGSIVERDEPLFWAIDPDEYIVVISRDRSLLTNQFEPIGSSQVTENRVATIPKPFFDDFDGPVDRDAPTMFAYGEPLFFIASKEEVVIGMCRVLTEDDSRDLLDDELVNRFQPE